MFDIHSVELTNFRSYKGTHKFEFPIAPGLYSLTGVNKTNGRLGSNGAGKSTLLDAVFWALYGRTSRGLKATDVVNYGQKGCQVTVSLTVGQTRALVSRSQSPNTLSLNDEIIDQGAVLGLVRLAPDAFTASVMLPQFGQSFFDLAPAAKLALFSQIMELEFWLERSEAAKAASAQLERKREGLDQSIAKAQGIIEGAKTDIKDIGGKAGIFDEAQNTIIKELEKELKPLVAFIKKDEDNLASIKKVLLGAEARLVKFAQELKLLEQQYQKASAQCQAINEHILLNKERGAATQRELTKLKGLKATCPTCRQRVDKSHLTEELAIMQDAVIFSEAEAASLQRQKLAAEQTAEKVEEKITKTNGDFEAVQRNKWDFESEQSKVAMLLESRRLDLARLKAEIKAEINRPNPYETLLRTKEKLLKLTTEELINLKLRLEALNADHAAVNYWVNGFKRVRLFIIEQALQQLEIEVNNNLTSLGLTNWWVEFDVERENKSGGITKGFVVMVHPPGHAEPVRYEAYSGGETQRLRLAGDLGLANLIMERAGLTNTIEFFDEPSQHLSQEGMLDLAETLNDRALTMNKRIWLIDHHTLDYGDFAGTYTVVKDKNESHIEEA